jgi:hypothetical protein
LLGPLPVVVRAWSSGIQVIALRSYLKPLAFFSASLLEFITRYQSLLPFFAACTASSHGGVSNLIKLRWKAVPQARKGLPPAARSEAARASSQHTSPPQHPGADSSPVTAAMRPPMMSRWQARSTPSP